MNRALLSTGKDNWETPTDFFQELDKEFHFTLDPCADDTNHKCDLYYTEEQDGLKQSWKGHTVFCNPPYSRKTKQSPGQEDWIRKCLEESRHATVVMLIPARTDTKAFHEYILPFAKVRFVKGRLKFVGAKHTAPFPCMVVIFNGSRKGAIL